MGVQWLSGKVLDSRLRGHGFKPHQGHCIVSLSKNINPSLVLVQSKKNPPFITERLLMGCKDSNQTKNCTIFPEMYDSGMRKRKCLYPQQDGDRHRPMYRFLPVCLREVGEEHTNSSVQVKIRLIFSFIGHHQRYSERGMLPAGTQH